jgi:hypothetical protein
MKRHVFDFHSDKEFVVDGSTHGTNFPPAPETSIQQFPPFPQRTGIGFFPEPMLGPERQEKAATSLNSETSLKNDGGKKVTAFHCPLCPAAFEQLTEWMLHMRVQHPPSTMPFPGLPSTHFSSGATPSTRDNVTKLFLLLPDPRRGKKG